MWYCLMWSHRIEGRIRILLDSVDCPQRYDLMSECIRGLLQFDFFIEKY